MTTNDAVARLRDDMKRHIIGSTVAVQESDLRALLDRLESAENAIADALTELTEYTPVPFEVTYNEQVVNGAKDSLRTHAKRFGGRDDK